MILRNFISQQAFTVYMESSLRFEISLRSNWPKWNLHRSEFHYARSHVNADNKLPHTEVKFNPEVKSQTGLISLRVSCKRALSDKSDTRPIDSVAPDEDFVNSANLIGIFTCWPGCWKWIDYWFFAGKLEKNLTSHNV